MTGKLALLDELEKSDVTGRMVAAGLLQTSAVSGTRAEPGLFGRCAFTNAPCLETELAVSDISRQTYRVDEQARSEVSGKAGHKDEFIACFETRQTMALVEAERCEVTQKHVGPGILIACDVSGMRVLPSALGLCVATHKRAIKGLLVVSSVSQVTVLREVAVASADGQFCAPSEVQECFWSGRTAHPNDIRTCGLTGLPIHAEFATSIGPARLKPLVELLNGIRRNAEQSELWGKVAGRLSVALKSGKCRVEAAMLSPGKHRLACCSESKTLLGLRVRHIGSVYDLAGDTIIGRLADGKRNARVG